MKWLFLLLWPVVAFAKYGKDVGIRPYGIDTPEIIGQCAPERELAGQAQEATLQFLSKGPVMLHDVDRGKYFRILAHVRVNGEDLAEHLLKLGLAVPYNGSKKTHDWCAENTSHKNLQTGGK